jgi:AraC-like DNA-binding protein
MAQVAALSKALDQGVHNFTVCEVQRGFRLVGAPVNAATVYLVLKGEMHMSVPTHTPLEVPQGALVIVPPGLALAIAPAAGPAIDLAATPNLLMRTGGLPVFDAAHGGAGDLRVLVGRIHEADDGRSQLFTSMSAPLIDHMRGVRAVREAYRLILAEVDHPQLGSAALAAALMKTCLVTFVRRFAHAGQSAGAPVLSPHGRFAAVAGAILAHPSEAHSVDSLAAIVGMSRSTFTRQFTEIMGVSPMDYVLKLRLHHASGLLRSTAMPVKQVAAASGFLSRTHFSRSFRSHYGVDPTRFRAGPSAQPSVSPQQQPAPTTPLPE